MAVIDPGRLGKRSPPWCSSRYTLITVTPCTRMIT